MADDSDAPAAPIPAGPVDHRNALVRDTVVRASIWLGIAALLFLAWQASATLLLIFAGLVFAALIEAGMRGIARVWNGPRALRLAITVALLLLIIVGFLGWTGAQLAAQSDALGATLQQQVARLPGMLRQFGLANVVGGVEGLDGMGGIAERVLEMMGGAGTVIGGVIAALGNVAIIFFLGLFFAADPKTYERGALWLAPQDTRVALARAGTAVGHVLMRWVVGRVLTMILLGVLTGVGLSIAGIPLAFVLGVQTALLAFIPNIGAVIAGIPIILVGLSQGPAGAIAAASIYLGIQFIESYILTPYVEKKSVELPPAIVISVQILFGALFGIAGLALADPLAAVVIVLLQQLYIARGLDNPEVLEGQPVDAGRGATAELEMRSP